MGKVVGIEDRQRNKQREKAADIISDSVAKCNHCFPDKEAIESDLQKCDPEIEKATLELAFSSKVFFETDWKTCPEGKKFEICRRYAKAMLSLMSLVTGIPSSDILASLDEADQ